MREIKFRAWDKEAKRWTASGYWISSTTQQLEHIPQLEVTQYTGLRDKNGKEIYEGDIVRQYFAGEVWRGIVAITPTQGTIVSGKSVWPHDIEVIGNIYENPGLTKDTP